MVRVIMLLREVPPPTPGLRPWSSRSTATVSLGAAAIPEFVEMIADTGAGLNDFIPQVQDIITAGEF